MRTPTLPTPSASSLWPVPAPTHGTPAPRIHGPAGGLPALGAAGDDAFARALERSREAARAIARAGDARADERVRSTQADPARPPGLLPVSPAPSRTDRMRDPGPPRHGIEPAPRDGGVDPDGPGSGSGSAAQQGSTDAGAPARGSAASGGPAASAGSAAERQRRAAAAAAGRPYPGNEPAQAAVKEVVVCFAPEDAGRAGSTKPVGADATAAADALAAATAALRAAEQATAQAAAGADTGAAASAAPGATAAQAQAAGSAAAEAAGTATGQRGVLNDLRQRLARTGGAARDDADAASAAGERGAAASGQAAAGHVAGGASSADVLQPGGSLAAQPGTATHGLAAPGAHATATHSAATGTADAGAQGASVPGTGAAAVAPGAGGEAGVLAAGVPAALPSTAGPAAGAGAAAEALLWARPGSADFAPQLGAQLAVWVRDGVHEARLQLNPADMGPVRVDIVLDGSAAQVSFTAGNDDTRQALQGALPGLAGSLQEAGFTLAGGGVFDQPPQQRQGDQPAGAGSTQALAPAPDAAARAGSPQALQGLENRRRGLVDLVA